MPSDATGEYPIELLQAVSDWMRDCDRETRAKRGAELKLRCGDLDPQFRSVDSTAYRQLTLTGKYLIQSGKAYQLDESISSWTLDEEVAKELKGGVHPDKTVHITVIFAISPPEGSVVVNLAALMADREFSAAVESHRENVRHFSQGIGKWKNSQQEVVLELTSLSLDDVHSFGGFHRREDELPDLWKAWGLDADGANHFFKLSSIVPGSEKWITDPAAVKRLVGKWVFHANQWA